MSFEEFQDGHHGGNLGYRNRTILAILNHCVTVLPPIKFWLWWPSWISRISRWPPWRPSWISERNDFSNSESLCHCDASHQVLAQSDLRFGRRYHLKNFKMATMAPSWLSEQNDLAILNLCVTVMTPIMAAMRPSGILERNDFSNFESQSHCDASHQVSAQSDLQFGRRCRLKNFKMAAMAAILDIGTKRF